MRDDNEAFADMVARARQRAGHPRSKTLLVVDQGKELFTPAGEQERARFRRPLALGALTDAELRSAVTGPAELVGLESLVDAQGREFPNDTMAEVNVNDAAVIGADINRGNQLNVVIAFHIPADAQPTVIEFHDSMFSGGAKVALQ